MVVAERDVQKVVLQWLNLQRNCVAWRNSKGSSRASSARFVRYGIIAKGSSDIFGIINGLLLVVEVKAPGKKPTEEQAEFIDIVNKRGGVGLWCDSVDVLEAKMKERGLI